jgi:SAM-dependent methyltransferase
MTTPPPDAPACHICAAPGLHLIPGYRNLTRVTSDCKVWPKGGQLGVCGSCGAAQAVLDPKWHKDAETIYANYTIYHQSKGAEQNVFDSVTGQPANRSDALVRRLNLENVLPAQGRMLDYGCGNGSMLRSFGPVFRQWILAGLELSDARKSEIESIPHVEHLFTPPLSLVPGQFDLVTLIHCLEHIASPQTFLAEIRAKLTPAGLLLIQVPDCGSNPFSLLIADHATHFCLASLQNLVQKAGFEILVGTNQWVAKELTVIGRKDTAAPVPSINDGGDLDAASLTASVIWLESLGRQARTLASHKPFGLFGTSIAATFLSGELGVTVDFFVDEDPNRQGKTWCGRPIYAPSNAPAGGHVFIGLPPVVADRILARMTNLNLPARFYPPPALPAKVQP